MILGHRLIVYAKGLGKSWSSSHPLLHCRVHGEPMEERLFFVSMSMWDALSRAALAWVWAGRGGWWHGHAVPGPNLWGHGMALHVLTTGTNQPVTGSSASVFHASRASRARWWWRSVLVGVLPHKDPSVLLCLAGSPWESG